MISQTLAQCYEKIFAKAFSHKAIRAKTKLQTTLQTAKQQNKWQPRQQCKKTKVNGNPAIDWKPFLSSIFSQKQIEHLPFYFSSSEGILRKISLRREPFNKSSPRSTFCSVHLNRRSLVLRTRLYMHGRVGFSNEKVGVLVRIFAWSKIPFGLLKESKIKGTINKCKRKSS